jgi:cobalt/nickel transport system permease protein
MLFAMHIPDSVLARPWQVGGFVIAGVLALLGSLRLREEEIPRIAVMSAAFFVASLIHIPIPTRPHLLLSGLVGVILGPRAALAIPLGLLLQSLLFAHGGIGALGVNTVVMELPALAAWLLFRYLSVRALLLRPVWRWLVGFGLGFFGVAATAGLNCFVLLYGGVEDFDAFAYATLLVHVPVAAIEGLIVAATVSFLARVKPEMLGLDGNRATAGGSPAPTAAEGTPPPAAPPTDQAPP